MFYQMYVIGLVPKNQNVHLQKRLELNNIGDIFNFINFVADKYRNGYLSPEEVSSALASGQTSLWNHFIGERQKGNELALIALKPFSRQASVTSDSLGVATYPTKYAETQGIYDGNTSIKQIVHNELAYALNSVIYPIASYPRWIEGQGGITIYPNGVKTIQWHYLAYPTAPIMGYTTTTNTVVYNPLTSTQLEFDSQYWNDVILLSLPYIGVNLGNQDITSLQSLFNLNANNGNGND